MAASWSAVRPLGNSLKYSSNSLVPSRALSSSRRVAAEVDPQKTVPTESKQQPAVYPFYTPLAKLDPTTAHTPKDERRLIRRGLAPVGSRRQRAILAANPVSVPFSQLPYQCFQEARKVLVEDRKEKIKDLETARRRLQIVEVQDPAAVGGQRAKDVRLHSLRTRLAELTILTDINDPLVKKRFEDGEGDMDKPIYRFLADKEWRKYRYLLIKQRIEQFKIVPDLLPKLEPTADVKMHVGRRTIAPGSFLDSKITTIAPKLNCQVFDGGERLVTVVVVDSDVPNIEKDGFDYRCHYIATNIPISPKKTSIQMHASKFTALPWLPPHAQKGSPYHRLSLFILQQSKGVQLNAAEIKETTQRENFILRSFIDKHKLHPIGYTLFRTQWDDNMAEVMQQANIPGWDVQFKRERILPLPYKKKDGDRYR